MWAAIREFIMHALGLCGEPHASIITLWAPITYIIGLIVLWWRGVFTKK
jgi:hypothetical protein